VICEKQTLFNDLSLKKLWITARNKWQFLSDLFFYLSYRLINRRIGVDIVGSGMEIVMIKTDDNIPEMLFIIYIMFAVDICTVFILFTEVEYFGLNIRLIFGGNI
jgi:hypothetical protein